MSNPGSVSRARAGFRRNLGWMVAGNLVFTGAQGGMLVVLAQLGTPEVVGVFALSLALASPITLLAHMKLQDVLATDAGREYPVGVYFKVAGTMSIVALGLIWSVALVLGYPAATVQVILAMGVAKALESLTFIFYGVQQRYERMQGVALSLMARGIAGLVALGVLYTVTDDLLWGVLGIAFAYGAVLVLHDIPVAVRMLRDHQEAHWGERLGARRLAWAAAPLGLMALFNSLAVNMPRVLVERFRGEEALGVFSALAYLVAASTVLARALSQVAAPRLAQRFQAGDTDGFWSLVRRISTLALGYGGLNIVAGLLFGATVLGLLYGDIYADESALFVLLLSYGALLYVAMMLIQAMIAARRFRAQLVLGGTVLVAELIAGLLLVDRFGLAGAGWTLLIAVGLQVLGSFVILRGVGSASSSRTAEPIIGPDQQGMLS